MPTDDELRDKPITIMVSESIRSRVEAAAKREDRSISWWGQAALEEKLKREEKGR